MQLSPFLNALFVFGCKQRNKIKVLYWDKTGFCLWYKRLEKDKFKWPRRMDGDVQGSTSVAGVGYAGATDVLLLDKEQFEWLLRGFDIQHMRPHREHFYAEVA
jgi:hypothetical protein